MNVFEGTWGVAVIANQKSALVGTAAFALGIYSISDVAMKIYLLISASGWPLFLWAAMRLERYGKIVIVAVGAGIVFLIV